MKIWFLNTTLSCISKCLRFKFSMINKKIISGLFILNLLMGCTSPTAMLGPAYTMSSSGNTLQAGLSYGSNKLKINNPEIIFLLIMFAWNLNHLDIHLKVVFKKQIFINKFN